MKIKASAGEAKQVTLKRNLWAPNLHTVRPRHVTSAATLCPLPSSHLPISPRCDYATPGCNPVSLTTIFPSTIFPSYHLTTLPSYHPAILPSYTRLQPSVSSRLPILPSYRLTVVSPYHLTI